MTNKTEVKARLNGTYVPDNTEQKGMPPMSGSGVVSDTTDPPAEGEPVCRKKNNDGICTDKMSSRKGMVCTKEIEDVCGRWKPSVVLNSSMKKLPDGWNPLCLECNDKKWVRIDGVEYTHKPCPSCSDKGETGITKLTPEQVSEGYNTVPEDDGPELQSECPWDDTSSSEPDNVPGQYRDMLEITNNKLIDKIESLENEVAELKGKITIGIFTVDGKGKEYDATSEATIKLKEFNDIMNEENDRLLSVNTRIETEIDTLRNENEQLRADLKEMERQRDEAKSDYLQCTKAREDREKKVEFWYQKAGECEQGLEQVKKERGELKNELEGGYTGDTCSVCCGEGAVLLKEPVFVADWIKVPDGFMPCARCMGIGKVGGNTGNKQEE